MALSVMESNKTEPLSPIYFSCKYDHIHSSQGKEKKHFFSPKWNIRSLQRWIFEGKKKEKKFYYNVSVQIYQNAGFP